MGEETVCGEEVNCWKESQKKVGKQTEKEKQEAEGGGGTDGGVAEKKKREKLGSVEGGE